MKIKSWLALAETIPQGNLGNVQEGSGKESEKIILAISAIDVDLPITFFVIVPRKMRLVVESAVAVVVEEE